MARTRKATASPRHTPDVLSTLRFDSPLSHLHALVWSGALPSLMHHERHLDLLESRDLSRRDFYRLYNTLHGLSIQPEPGSVSLYSEENVARAVILRRTLARELVSILTSATPAKSARLAPGTLRFDTHRAPRLRLTEFYTPKSKR